MVRAVSHQARTLLAASCSTMGGARKAKAKPSQGGDGVLTKNGKILLDMHGKPFKVKRECPEAHARRASNTQQP
eukprot:14645143-Alexandrium_andersonii.AAC.1